MIILALVTAALAVGARMAMARLAADGARVDHYYWMLAAQAYRRQRGLPVRLPGKYLLEDDRQGYPPLFGILLGRWRLERWGVAVAPGLEVIQMAILAVVLMYLRAPVVAIAFALAWYAATPVLVTYNLQLNARMLGDNFLFLLLACELIATQRTGSIAIAGWLAATLLTALVILTHKMTLQLYAVLVVPWAAALGSALPVVVMAAGAILYMTLVGQTFAAYQFAMHAALVTFWDRNWRHLGAHQFRRSPLYGSEDADCASCFHGPGVRGMVKHLRIIVSYAPGILMLPVASVVAGQWPPAWLLVWLGVIYAWSLATLFIPGLKCLGGGHLYLFNAVAPAAIWIAWLPATGPVVLALSVGVVLTAVSLVAAWRVISSRPAPRDAGFQQALSVLKDEPPARVAVFPLQGAEAVAWATPHGVLWGGHGSGVSLFEDFFPILRQPLSVFLQRYDIRWVLCDDRYWRLGREELAREGMTSRGERVFGTWRLTELVTAAAQA